MKSLHVFVIALHLFNFTWASESIEISLKNEKYLISPTHIDTESIQRSLSPEDYKSFLNTRADFLSMSAKALQSIKIGFGLGSVIKNHFEYKSENRSIEKLIADSEKMPTHLRMEIEAVIERERPLIEQKQIEYKTQKFHEKSKLIISQILNSLDAQLWSQAAIVSHANEFGVLAAVGVQAEGGSFRGDGRGGLTDFGLSIGFNKDDKSVAIQIFNDIESFKSTKMPLIVIGGIVGKAGLYISNQDKNLSDQGSSFYPPMVPGFSSSLKNRFMFGLSSGLTWPPAPLGDMLTYSNRLYQTTILRVTISPLTKGFVRVHFGNLKEFVSISLVGIKNLISSTRINSHKVRCENLF